MRLAGKVILVTGSTTGIGEAIARRVVADGGRVIVHGLERELGEAVVRELGDAARLHVGELASPTFPTELVRFAREAFGGQLHGLVNNAAFIPRANIATTDVGVF